MDTTPTPRSIDEIMQELREHPDYVFGTVFVWGDVESTLANLIDSGDVPADVDPADLRNFSRALERTLETRCLEVSEWGEGLGDALMDIAPQLKRKGG